MRHRDLVLIPVGAHARFGRRQSANIFVTASDDAKIGDLGVSKLLATHQALIQ